MQFYFGRVCWSPIHYPTTSPEWALLMRDMRWHFVDHCNDETNDIWVYGVCPRFKLVDVGGGVPSYRAILDRDISGELKLARFEALS